MEGFETSFKTDAIAFSFAKTNQPSLYFLFANVLTFLVWGRSLRDRPVVSFIRSRERARFVGPGLSSRS